MVKIDFSKMSKEESAGWIIGIIYVLITIMFMMMWIISHNQINNHYKDKKEVSNNLKNVNLIGMSGTILCLALLLVAGRAFFGLGAV